jgi:hypothetical protein
MISSSACSWRNQLPLLVAQFHDAIGFYIQGGPAGGGVVDNAGNGVFLGGLDGYDKPVAPLGNQLFLNGTGLALQNALQPLANALRIVFSLLRMPPSLALARSATSPRSSMQW